MSEEPESVRALSGMFKKQDSESAIRIYTEFKWSVTKATTYEEIIRAANIAIEACSKGRLAIQSTAFRVEVEAKFRQAIDAASQAEKAGTVVAHCLKCELPKLFCKC